MQPPRRGAWLVGAYTLVIAGLVSALISVPEPGAEEWRAAIRVTAFMSVVPFALAFTASALARLRPSSATRWLVANRRYLGLSFAVSHLAHAGAIAALGLHAPSFFANVSTTTLVGGGLGYVFVGLMAATSNDGAQRRLGRAWGVLHTVGIYYLWFIFLFTYMGPAPQSVFHAVMTVLLTAAWAVRLAARMRSPSRARAGRLASVDRLTTHA
jgi:DMSO/TMAO reductase YedYZ heme-binding membrane subunit